MRGLVLMEGLRGGQLPMPMKATVLRRYPHLLGGQTPVQIAEIMVPRDRAVTVAMQLADALLPQRFYSHLLDQDRMYVAFPRCVVAVHRDDPTSIALAQAIGAMFAIPREQMRFDAMFDNDHPDSPTSAAGRDTAWSR